MTIDGDPIQGQTHRMMTPPATPLYKRHRFPAEIISHCVWLYFRFSLSYCDVEEMMLERGTLVSHEAVRYWCRKFGQAYATQLRRRRPRPGDKWHLDEAFLTIKLKALKRVAKLTGLSLHRSYLNLDGGFDSKFNRKVIFNAGLIPNIKENPRNRKAPKRGRKRLFDAAIHTLRDRVERTFAWEDKFKRLWLRFEHIQQRHYAMKLMAYTLINVRHVCGT